MHHSKGYNNFSPYWLLVKKTHWFDYLGIFFWNTTVESFLAPVRVFVAFSKEIFATQALRTKDDRNILDFMIGTGNHGVLISRWRTGSRLELRTADSVTPKKLYVICILLFISVTIVSQKNQLTVNGLLLNFSSLSRFP